MDIETILKETGMSEGELISYVNEMSNQGFTSDEIYKSLMQPVMDKNVATNKQRNLFKQITGISDDSLLGKMMPSVQIPMKTEAQKKADFPQGLDLLSYGVRGVTPKEPVVEEEVIDDPDWKHHTDPAGNSKPGDNGWTDLKRFGSWVGNGIGDTFKSAADYDNSMNQDLLHDLGMVYKLGLGDNSILQMWNQNEQAELARKQQQEYNDYWKRVELAADQKEKDAAAARAKAAEDKQNAEELKAAIVAADSQEAVVLDASGNGIDMSAVSNVMKDKFKQAVDFVAAKGGDVSKYAPMMKALFPEAADEEADEEETKPVEQAKPKKTEPAKPTVNVAQLAQERKSIDSTKPTVLDEFHISSIRSYNAKAQKFNAVLRKNNVTTVDPLPILSIPTTKPQQKAQEDAMAEADKKKAVKAIHDKIAAGTAPTQEEWNQVKSQYDRKSLSAYNGLSDEEKKQYKKAGAWYYKKK